MTTPHPVNGSRPDVVALVTDLIFATRIGGTARSLGASCTIVRTADAVVAAVQAPVQAVGGLTVEQAIRTPEYGAPLVVLGAPLTIDADAFKTAFGDVESALRLICEQVHAYGDSDFGF